MKLLHITNGDVTAESIRHSGLAGEVVVWRDMLHEGPVPPGLALEELSRVRARFLSECPWGGPFEEVLREFGRRDRALQGFKRVDEVTLWFEHDLFDQLQLLQLLHWFAVRAASVRGLSLICIGEHPAVESFRGLGQLTADQIGALYEQRVGITAEQLDLGRRGWEAFTADRPQGLEQLAGTDHPALPFLRPALQRHLQQYPSTRDGLTRSEKQILEALIGGAAELREVFQVSQIDAEPAPFMGDQAFLLQVETLRSGDQPLLRFEDGEDLGPRPDPTAEQAVWKRRLVATEAGRRVLSGQADRSRFQTFDRWLGGVHLVGAQIPWRWNARRGALEAQRTG